MRNLFLIGLLLINLILFGGCVEKECESDADCLTKTCFTVQCVDDKCVYSTVTDCCGNDKCEVGETYENCVADCPNCDDANECTKDSYDYHEQTCINEFIISCYDELCKKITDITEKDKCYENSALEIFESILCEKISDSNLRGRCINTIAQETKDASLCAILPEIFNKGNCYHNIAMKTKDVSLCGKITDHELIKHVCYAILTNNAGVCEELSLPHKDRCYSNVAIEIKDANLCENIVDSEVRDACYSDITMYTKDISLCEKIEGYRKEECYKRVE